MNDKLSSIKAPDKIKKSLFPENFEDIDRILK